LNKVYGPTNVLGEVICVLGTNTFPDGWTF